MAVSESAKRDLLAQLNPTTNKVELRVAYQVSEDGKKVAIGYNKLYNYASALITQQARIVISAMDNDGKLEPGLTGYFNADISTEMSTTEFKI